MLIEMMVAMGAAATANAASPVTLMTIDGDRVTYSETVDDDGVRRIRGQRLTDGQRFNFRVARDGRVRGSVGTQTVNFRVGPAR